ncbi:hypothetical protein TBR22_A02170 [Luteitalea sp. TBR-22]|nr:hypothetical protein TBR22_A02170 [Luteitalea sp. TBR-22]
MRPPGTRVRFGRFELDAANVDLRKDGRRMRLRPQALTLLGLLVDRAGELVTREEVRAALWPNDTFVDFDHGLNSTIADVRRVLGDSAARPRLIETIPRKGYRFIGTVEVIDDAPLRRGRSDQASTPADDSGGVAILPAPVGPAVPAATEASTAGPGPSARVKETVPSAGSHERRRVIAGAAVAACLLLAVRSMADYLPWRAPATAAVTVAARSRDTERPEAWQAYARARVYWSTRSDCARATVEYREAARLDPAFALPWVGIADCFTVNGNRQEAQAALGEAERRAPNLGEVHASRGFIRMFLAWDWVGAEESFTTAMRLAPEYASAWQWAGLLSLFRGDVATAHSRLAHAVALDPASAVIASDLAWAELARGRPREALDLCRQARRLTPEMVFNGTCLAAAWQRLGRPDEVLAVHTGQSPSPGADAAADLQAYYRTRLAGALARPSIPAHTTSALYAALGDTDRALYWLEVAVHNQEFMTPFTVLDPKFDSLRGHSRFRELMDRVGLATGEPHS